MSESEEKGFDYLEYRPKTHGWLKAGFVEKGKGYAPTVKVTPQGGVISPLLANIGLYGLETYIKERNPKVGIIRYADDFVITAKDKESFTTRNWPINIMVYKNISSGKFLIIK